jgi:pimeloyl-ACP methyl ester carboxylesterase
MLVPDLRGHGRSTNPAGQFTFRQVAKEMFVLLDRLGLERVNAIGLSAGAKTLLHMAFTPPLLATIAARTLIVHGDRDPIYPVEMAMELYRSIPRSALWTVPNGGHGPIFGPQAPPFVDAALAFLGSK